MSAAETFKEILGGVESVPYIIVPSFAIHAITSHVLPSLIYNRSGIRPVQWLQPDLVATVKFECTSDGQWQSKLFSCLETYLELLRSDERFSKQIKNIEASSCTKPVNYRAVLLRPDTSADEMYEAHENFFTGIFNRNERKIHVYKTKVHFSFWHVTLADSLKRLFQSTFDSLAPLNDTSEAKNQKISWEDFYVHSFEQVGHIAHLNLPSVFSISKSTAVRDMKFTLGSLILDHHPHLSIVINKARNIDSEFREMAIEVLAARPPVAAVRDSTTETFYFSPDVPNDTPEVYVLPSISSTKPNESNFTLQERPSQRPISSTVARQLYIGSKLPAEAPIFCAKKIKHNGCLFTFSFFHCFFNKRLEEEHRTIKNFLAREDACSDVVFDVFAGVGPISIPIAAERASLCASLNKKKALPSSVVGVIHANDLNPECYRYLKQNMDSNQVSLSSVPGSERKMKMPKTNISSAQVETSYLHASLYSNAEAAQNERLIHAWNMDGLDFISASLRHWTKQNHAKENETAKFCHFIMNLPGSAAENFLTPFAKVIDTAKNDEDMSVWPNKWNPTTGDGVIVHVYTFTLKTINDNQEAVEKVYAGLHKQTAASLMTLEEFQSSYLLCPPQTIRNIAPRKQMVRVSFVLCPKTAMAYRADRNLI